MGALARYGTARLVPSPDPVSFPWATFLVNVTGSILIGILYRYIGDTASSDHARAFLGIGFCGGFTTFSAFSYETVRMMQEGHAARAALFVFASVGLCLAGTVAGTAIGDAMLRR